MPAPTPRRLRLETLESRQLLSADPSWLTTLGSASGQTANDVTTGPNGDFYVTGNFSGTLDFDPGPGAFSLTAPTGSQGFVARYAAADGALVWAKRFLGQAGASGSGLAVDAAGNVYVAGSFNGASVDLNADGTADVIGAGSGDAFVIRLDAAGNLAWSRSFGGPANDSALAIGLDASGGVYVAGQLTSESLAIGQSTLNRDGATMSYIARLDATGNVAWVRELDGATANDAVRVQNMAVSDSGAVAIAAWYAGTGDLGADANNDAVLLSQINSGDANDGLAAIYDAVGTLHWAYATDGTVNDVAIDGQGNVYSIGAFRDVDDFDPSGGHLGDPDVLGSTADSLDAFILKVESTGAFQQVVRLSGAGVERANAIAVAVDGRVHVVGSFEGRARFGAVELRAAGSTDAFLAELDAELNVLAVHRAGLSGNTSTSDLAVDGAGNIIAAGSFNGAAEFPTANVATADGPSHIFVLKWNPNLPVIAGGVFADLNLDGIDNDSNRAIAAGWTVYLDQNQNGQRDPGEMFTTTREGSGNFTFGNVPAGTYTVAQELPPGWSQTTPVDGSGAPVAPTLALVDGGTSPRISFGNFVPSQTTTFASSDAPKKVNGSGNPVSSVLTVSAADVATVLDVDLYIEATDDPSQAVRLEIFLASATGKRISLKDYFPHSLTMQGTVFDDEADVSIAVATTPYTGRFRPSMDDLALLDGEDMRGTWTLEIKRVAYSKSATLDAWGLTITHAVIPAAPTPPTIDSLIDSPDPVIQGNTLTLTAGGVADADGVVTKVDFYRDADANGLFDVGTDELIGSDASGADGWSVTISTAPLALGTYTYFAIATDNDGQASNVATAIGQVIAQPIGNPNDIYVWDIGFDSQKRGKNTDWRLVIGINRDSDADGLASSTDASAAGVYVTVELKSASGQLVGTFTGTTDSAGVFRSDWIRGLSGGSYTAEVIDVVHETFDWNKALDNELDADNDGLPDDVLPV